MTDLFWRDLRLSNIDLHFHAGTERPEHCSLRDFLDFAVATGRRLIGVTDHFGRFTGASRKQLNHYAGSPEGYRRFINEVHEVGSGYPHAVVLFAPEVGLAHLEGETAAMALGEPGVDLLIGEPSRPGEGETLGEYLVRGIEMIADAREEFDVPGFLAHPFRGSINSIVGKGGPGPRMPIHEPFPPLYETEDPVEEVEKLLELDISKLARVSIREKVPFEINESSWGRIMGMNHESFAERYLLFFRTFIDEGGEVVLGSDLHNAEHPSPTPFSLAKALGVKVTDMSLLSRWVGGERE